MKHHYLVVHFSHDTLWGDTDPIGNGYDPAKSAEQFRAQLQAALAQAFPDCETEVVQADDNLVRYDGQASAPETETAREIVDNLYDGWEWAVNLDPGWDAEAYTIMREWDREIGIPPRHYKELDYEIPGSLSGRWEYHQWKYALTQQDVAAILEGRSAWGLPLLN